MHQLPWYADYSPTQLKNGIKETEDEDNAAASAVICAVNNVLKMLIHEK